MNKEFKDMRYLSDLLTERTDTYYFKVDEIKYLLNRIHDRVSLLLENLDAVASTLNLYDKVVKGTDEELGDTSKPVGIELTGADVFTLMLCVFSDPYPGNMRDKIYFDLHLGLLSMIINTPEEV